MFKETSTRQWSSKHNKPRCQWVGLKTSPNKGLVSSQKSALSIQKQFSMLASPMGFFASQNLAIALETRACLNRSLSAHLFITAHVLWEVMFVMLVSASGGTPWQGTSQVKMGSGQDRMEYPPARSRWDNNWLGQDVVSPQPGQNGVPLPQDWGSLSPSSPRIGYAVRVTGLAVSHRRANLLMLIITIRWQRYYTMYPRNY